MNDQNTANVLQWLSNRENTVKSCTFLKELMTSENADEIIHLWLDLGFPSETSRVERVCELMTELESLTEICPEESLLLMTSLQPIASDLYLYEIYDSIGLWLHEHGLKLNNPIL